MRRARPIAVVLVAVILSLVGDSRGATAAAGTWTGGETLGPLSVGPNVARCGAFPRNLEARLSGAGVDTEGGPYLVVASGCLDTDASTLFDLRATDTYLRTGDSLRIAPDDVALDVDPATCVATNPAPVAFEVAGGSGRYSEARGAGTFTLVMTMPDCIGPQAPAQLWFTGEITTGR